jgi:hypothetical protein
VYVVDEHCESTCGEVDNENQDRVIDIQVVMVPP